MPRQRRLSRVAAVALTLTARGKALLPAADQASSRILRSPPRGLVPPSIVGPEASCTAAHPPAWSFCLATLGVACRRRSDIQNQYNSPPLRAKKDTGCGQAAVIFGSFGSPAMRHDRATFGLAFGLAAAPSLKIYTPEGEVTCHGTQVRARRISTTRTPRPRSAGPTTPRLRSTGRTPWHRAAPASTWWWPLGFLTARPYQICKDPIPYAEAFHDITCGSKSSAGITGYSAAPGGDAATGLGTPDAAGPADALTLTTS
jgi:hypothetical protein